MSTTLTYPTGGWGAPKDRRPAARRPTSGCPSGTEVFSADNHISLSEDIFVERAPESMKDRVPQVLNVDGGWAVGMGGQSILHPQFLEVLTQYDPLPGSHAGDVDARLAALDSEGVDKELAFPNSILALFGWPDKEVREVCFRIYNEYIADVQERSGGRIYGVGLINWWDADGTRRTLEELKSLGLTTFLMPLNPGKDDNKVPIDYASTAMDDVWSVIEEAGLPVSHHIGESPPATPNEYNAVEIGMLQSVAPFRDPFGKYVFGGILDRHPGLQVGWFEGGINWVPSVLQDAEHLAASFHHINNLDPRARPAVLLGAPHDGVVHARPARPRPDRPHRRRPGDVVDRLPAQREHLRLQQRVAGDGRRARSVPTMRRRSSTATSSATSDSPADAGRTDGQRRRRRGSRRSPTSAGCAASAPNECVRIMRDQGIDALVLLGQHERRSTRRAPSGRSPTRGGPTSSSRSRWCSPTTSSRTSGRPSATTSGCAPISRPTTCTVPCTSTSTRASPASPPSWPRCEHRGRHRHRRVDPCAPTQRVLLRRRSAARRADSVISRAKLVKTPDELSCMRDVAAHHRDRHRRGAGAARARRAPDRPHRHVPAHDLRPRRRRQHPRADLAGDDAVDERRAVDDDRRARLPAAVDRARARRGRRAVGRHLRHLERLPLRLRPHLDRRPRARRPPARAVRAVESRSSPRSSTSPAPAPPAPT